MRYFDYSPMYYHMSFWPGGFISLLINILIWGVIIYLFVHLVRKMTARGHAGCCGMHGHDHSLENDNSSYVGIVKMRYAKGEIDKKHFDELMKEFSDESEEQEPKEQMDTAKAKE